MSDTIELAIELSSGTYRVTFPDRSGEPENILVENAAGEVYVPVLAERLEILKVYEFLNYLSPAETISEGLAGIRDSFWSSYDTIDGGYIERVIDYTNNEIRVLQNRLDAGLLERVAEQGAEFAKLAVDMAWGVVINVVLEASRNPFRALINGMSEVSALTDAIQIGFGLSNAEEVSSISALTAARTALGELRSLQNDLAGQIDEIRDADSDAVFSVDQILEMEQGFGRVGFLISSLSNLISFHQSQFPPEDWDSPGVLQEVLNFLNSPIEFGYLLNFVPILGPAKSIALDLYGSIIAALAEDGVSDQIARLSGPVEDVLNVESGMIFRESEVFLNLEETIEALAARGTDENDTIYGGEGDATIDARAGDDYIRLDDGNGLVIGGAGQDTVAVPTDLDFDLDRLVERVDGSFEYRLGDGRTIALESVEYLRFVQGETVTAEYPLEGTTRLFGLDPALGIVEVFSSSVSESISDDPVDGVGSAHSLTVDGAGNFSVLSSDWVNFRNLGGHYASNPGVRVTSFDPTDGDVVRSDLYIGSYSHSISPPAFEYVPGAGEIALGTVNYGGSLFYGLSLTRGVDDLEGFGRFLSDVPVGTANWHYNAGNPSDPLFNEFMPDLSGSIADTAAAGGRLVALSNHAEVDGHSQRLLTISTPLNDNNDFRTDNAYRHKVFLDAAARLTAIAYNEAGQLFGIGSIAGAGASDQTLFSIDERSGDLTEIGALPGVYNDFVVSGSADELAEILSPAAHVPITGTAGSDELAGTARRDTLHGAEGDDILRGNAGDDSLDGGPGADTINGGDGRDTIVGGPSDGDRRDVIYAGDGDDSVDAGAGNDLVYGQRGNDTIAGGFGADELFGQDGRDVITGSAFSDLIFGGAGNDFVNGGFGFDRVNGGAGADRFFHAGAEGHASDWIQDYAAAEGDVLVFGGTGARASDFVVRFAHTSSPAGERSGDDDVREAFVNLRGQTLWALVDGGGEGEINLRIGTETFDLLS